MKFKCVFILVSLVLTAQVIHAQDFDADSIYYSTISKSATKKTFPRKIFVDTVKNSKPIEYFFDVQMGPLIGCTNCGDGKAVTFTSSTIHGVTIGRKLRAGLGVGLDSYYSWQTMPFFGNVSWDLIGTKNTQAIVVQFGYGWSMAWREKRMFDNSFTGTDGGRMMNAQIGYRIKYHDLKISLAAGTKLQRLYTYVEYSSGYATPNKMTTKYDMQRLMISLAIGWK